MLVTGWRCMVCGATRGIAEPLPWRCPNAVGSDRHHVLAIVEEAESEGLARSQAVESGTTNPFVVYDDRLAWAAYADAHGIDADERRAMVECVDRALRGASASIWGTAVPEGDTNRPEIGTGANAADGGRDLGQMRPGRRDEDAPDRRGAGGVGFVATPFGRSDALSDALGFADGGGVWVKDETGGVGGSHKARHLATILFHLLAAERIGHLNERPPLAIASCGNAALAAATLAAAAEWPLDVYVPTWMNPAFGTEMERLGARIHPCERRAADPPGDPAMLRFRDAVAAGAIPFSVQGPENALCLDGGRTLGWEIADEAARLGDSRRLGRIYVQVGGGAMAASVGRALRRTMSLRVVQAAGCAPLARAWERAGGDLDDIAHLGQHWSDLMEPWPDPHSVADGILDDETYDWLGIVDALGGPWGSAPIVASEDDIVAAHQLATAAGFDVSPTGSAGLAGVLAEVDTIVPTDRVVVIMSGVQR